MRALLVCRVTSRQQKHCFCSELEIETDHTDGYDTRERSQNLGGHVIVVARNHVMH